MILPQVPSDQLFDPAAILPPSDDTRDGRDPKHIVALAANIARSGQKHPAYLRKRPDGELEVVTGECRRLACVEAGLPLWGLVIEGELTPARLLMERLLENAMRKGFRPVETARIYHELMRLNGWTAAELSRQIKVAEGSISRAMTMLARLPDELKAEVDPIV